MLKVILLIDNYNELSFLQTTLKNLGFDTVAIQRESQLEETLLSFRTDVIIATGSSKKINGVRIAAYLHKKKKPPKILLLFPTNQAPILEGPLAEIVSDIIHTPVKPVDLFNGLAKAGNIDINVLIEKQSRLYQARQKSASSSSEMTHIKSKNEESFIAKKLKSDEVNEPIEYFSKENCEKRFDEILKKTPPPTISNFNREAIIAHHAKLKESSDHDTYKKIDEERQAFVRALFNKHQS